MMASKNASFGEKKTKKNKHDLVYNTHFPSHSTFKKRFRDVSIAIRS